MRKLLIKKLKGRSDLKAGPDYEETVAQNAILNLTRLNGLFGSDKQDRQNQKVSSLLLV